MLRRYREDSPDQKTNSVEVTYWVNRLQNIPESSALLIITSFSCSRSKCLACLREQTGRFS